MATKRDDLPESSQGGRPNKILVLLLCIMLAFNLHQQMQSTTALYVGAHQNHLGFSHTGDGDLYYEVEDEADAIIRKSYEKSYAHILPCDEAHPSGKSCMLKTTTYFNTPSEDGNYTNTNTNTNVPSIPWWFQTLLRDIPNNGAYGFWHHFYTSEPAINFCTIGKVATTEWRRVFCKLNAEECEVPGSCGKRGCMWRTKKEMPEDAPWAVFLRDPLERLLSGYLDKCYKPKVREKEGHCQPNAVFNAAPGLENEKGKPYPDLMEHLEDKDKQMFAAYVDVLPLKWNVHFIPQAIACDLHRNIATYDFVGNMGADFMFDLERMANQFGDPLSAALNSSYGYLDRVQSGEKNMGRDNNHHATHAPAKVTKFFTAQTVRRGLELLSIDYVKLGLEVPEWARQMLRDDVA